MNLMNNNLNRKKKNSWKHKLLLTFLFEHILGNLIVLCHTALGIQIQDPETQLCKYLPYKEIQHTRHGKYMVCCQNSISEVNYYFPLYQKIMCKALKKKKTTTILMPFSISHCIVFS